MLELLNSLKAAPGVEDAYPFGEYHHVVMKHAADENALKEIISRQQPGVEIIPVEPDIEDCFMALMKN